MFEDISMFSSGGLFVQWNQTVCASWVEDVMINISVKLF